MNSMIRLIAALGLAACSLVTVAQEQVDKTLDVANGTRVFLNNERGQLTVVSHQQDKVRLVGTLDERAEDFIFEMRGNGVRIEVRTPEQNGWHYDNDDGSKLKLYMPSNSPLKVEGVSMDVEIDNLSGGVAVNLVSGDVAVENASQRIKLQTVSGNIKTKQLAGEVILESVSGDIDDLDNRASEATYQAVSGDVTVRSTTLQTVSLQNVSGDVDMQLGKVNEGRFKNVSGDVDVTLGLSNTASFEANSVSGDLQFSFRNEVDAQFSLKTNAGGDIVNRLTSDKPSESRWGSASSLNFSTVNGGAQVKMSTVSGTIEIGRD